MIAYGASLREYIYHESKARQDRATFGEPAQIASTKESKHCHKCGAERGPGHTTRLGKNIPGGLDLVIPCTRTQLKQLNEQFAEIAKKSESRMAISAACLCGNCGKTF